MTINSKPLSKSLKCGSNANFIQTIDLLTNTMFCLQILKSYDFTSEISFRLSDNNILQFVYFALNYLKF